jgi:uncharacterized protein (TIGR02145 family)
LLSLILILGIACKHKEEIMNCDVLNITLSNPTLYKKSVPLFDIETANSSTFNKVSKYGYLYNWKTVTNANFAPVGWHVPTATELQDLVNYLGGGAIAGPKLRDSDPQYWIGSFSSTNESRFSARGTGQRHGGTTFDFETIINRVWASTSINATLAYVLTIDVITDNSNVGGTTKAWGNSVRLIKDSQDWTEGETLTDIDGNVYPTIKIGNQVWIAEYWRCTKLNDGIAIPNVVNAAQWNGNPNLAYCSYDNNDSNAYQTVEFIQASSTNPNLPYVDNTFLANSIQSKPLTINRITYSCSNPLQQFNNIKETVKTMFGDSVERMINFQNYVDPLNPNPVIVIDLEEPITISADEFIKMDLEAQTDVYLLLEYCQLSSSDIVNNIDNSNNNILQTNSNDIINNNDIVIIKKQAVKAGLDIPKFPIVLIVCAIAYLLYKNYKK